MLRLHKIYMTHKYSIKISLSPLPYLFSLHFFNLSLFLFFLLFLFSCSFIFICLSHFFLENQNKYLMLVKKKKEKKVNSNRTLQTSINTVKHGGKYYYIPDQKCCVIIHAYKFVIIKINYC